MKKIMTLFVFCISYTAFADSKKVYEAEGTANVNANPNDSDDVAYIDHSAYITIDGEAATVLHNGMEVSASTDGRELKIIRRLDGSNAIRCERDGRDYSCIVGVENANVKKRGKGRARAIYDGESLSLSLERQGSAARSLFDALDVEAKTPPYSKSKIKLIKGVLQCTKNDADYDCLLAIPTTK